MKTVLEISQKKMFIASGLRTLKPNGATKNARIHPMLITYTAPNRAHHYPYATALNAAGILKAFVSGFSRFATTAANPILGRKLIRKDELQTMYVCSLKSGMCPAGVSEILADYSKRYLDLASFHHARESDIFLAYNGCGLGTFKKLKQSKTIRIVEVVNTHVDVQEIILREEFERTGNRFRPFPAAEKARRIEEYYEADYILCPSEFVRRSFIDRGFKESVLIKNIFGASVSDTSLEPRRQDADKFVVLFVGTVSLRKGVRYLLEAFNKINIRNSELWIVGPMGQPTGLENSEIPANVKMLGVLKGKDLSMAYQSASVFVLPSIEEGLALVLGEAMAHGLPVIATSSSGGEDLFENGCEGFIIEPRNPKMIAEKLSLLHTDLNLRNRMSIAASERLKSLGGWSDSGENLVKTLTTCFNAGRIHRYN